MTKEINTDNGISEIIERLRPRFLPGEKEVIEAVNELYVISQNLCKKSGQQHSELYDLSDAIHRILTKLLKAVK